MNRTNYPPTKKPLTKSNSPRATQKKANTFKPKATAKSAKANGSSDMLKYLVMAAMGGAAIAVFKDAGATPPSSTTPAPDSVPEKKPVQPGVTVVTRPTAPAPATTPVPTTQTTVYRPTAATTANGNYVFVDSWNGEGIYRETLPIYNSFTGYGRFHIVQLSNNCFVGLWTGKKQDNMLEIWMKTAAGVEYNFWIAADQVKMFNKAGYDQHMAGAGVAKTEHELNSIVNYFKK